MVKEGDLVMNCGAFMGITTLLCVRRVEKDGKVMAIEPEERNYEILLRTVKLNEGKSPPFCH